MTVSRKMAILMPGSIPSHLGRKVKSIFDGGLLRKEPSHFQNQDPDLLQTRQSCCYHLCPQGAPESTHKKAPFSCFKEHFVQTDNFKLLLLSQNIKTLQLLSNMTKLFDIFA